MKTTMLALMAFLALSFGPPGAEGETAKAVRVRIDFRTLKCVNTTEESGADEPYVTYLKILPGSAPTAPPQIGVIPSEDVGDVSAGEYAWNGDSRKILWEGNLKPGESAAFVVTVMEDDGSAPSWSEWAKNGTECGAGALTAAGGNAAGLLGCANLGFTIIQALNGDDLVGQFAVSVKNDNGVVKKTLHTSGKRTTIGAYKNEAPLSDSNKTIRIKLGQGKQNPQRYQASLQVREIRDVIADENGEALTWTIDGRDDAH